MKFPAIVFTVFYLCLAFADSGLTEDNNKIYKMCVPHKFFEDCLNILKDPSEAGIKMECVLGRDRIECLDLINQRKADVLAVEPEDMYVAYHMKNQDFRVISEFRTKVEKDAEFRYEGVILVKKSTNVNNLRDLHGLKSCHTGFGRNVGYKIPITKLKNHGVLKVSLDPSISATERELKALSEFFSQSCLVGTYSPHQEVDQILKKKYSNLCALCENPEQCNYPDKFSGYDGAIRCLDKGQGDVAFTKTSFIKKYFGLLGDSAEGNPNDFEYLCEDGSRKPITGPACSWAQRPWKGYISNIDSVKEQTLLQRLQQRLDEFFQNGLQVQNKRAASNLLIDSDLVLHDKPESVMPKEYLEKAGYKDVIERDGSMTHKIRLCVQYEIEFEKCDAMKRAAYSRDIRPEFECLLEMDCIAAVRENRSDALVVIANAYHEARDAKLTPMVYEALDEDNVYVVVVDSNMDSDLIRKSPVKFDKTNPRAHNAALLFNKNRGKNTCDELPDVSVEELAIVNAKDLHKFQGKQLVCPNLEKKSLSEYKNCNFESNLPAAVFVRKGLNHNEEESLKHAFISLSDKFGPKGKLEDVFEIFGIFKSGYFNVIFNDAAVEFVTELKNQNGVDEEMYNELNCLHH